MNQTELIEKAIVELFTRENDYSDACIAFATAEHAYRMAKASAYLAADGTVDERKAKADRSIAALMDEKLKAEARLEFTKAKLWDCRSVISARQSILSAEVRVHGAAERFQA